MSFICIGRFVCLLNFKFKTSPHTAKNCEISIFEIRRLWKKNYKHHLLSKSDGRLSEKNLLKIGRRNWKKEVRESSKVSGKFTNSVQDEFVFYSTNTNGKHYVRVEDVMSIFLIECTIDFEFEYNNIIEQKINKSRQLRVRRKSRVRKELKQMRVV